MRPATAFGRDWMQVPNPNDALVIQTTQSEDCLVLSAATAFEPDPLTAQLDLVQAVSDQKAAQ